MKLYLVTTSQSNQSERIRMSEMLMKQNHTKMSGIRTELGKEVRKGDRRDRTRTLISKIFEGIVYHQVYFYLWSTDLISKFQSGFRALHSTTTILLFATFNWHLNMDKGLINGALFLDQKRTFDWTLLIIKLC